MSLRSIRIIAPLATLVAALSCGGADSLAPTVSTLRTSDSTLLAGLYASAPVSGGYISADRITASGTDASSTASSAEVSWVSMVPGTVPDGATATISNLRTAQRFDVTTVDGGFDPQPIPASLGDTVQVSVSSPGKPQTAAVMSLAARPGPRVVRSRPPRGQTDAPLNTIITLVFTEPLDPASVNPSTVTLTKAGSPVDGEVRIPSGPGYTIEFTPSTLLTPNTTYALTVSGVATPAGTPLAAPTSISFTTSASLQVREIPVKARFLAEGLTQPGTGASLPTNWSSRDPSIAGVTPLGAYAAYVLGIRPGTTIIEKSSVFATATIAVTVLAAAPASAVSPVAVDFRMREFRYDPSSTFWSYAPEIVLRDTTGLGGSAIIGVSFDLPGLGPSPWCAMERPVGSNPLEVFKESYGDFELTIDGGGVRASGSEAVAHVTLRIPGPAAMTFDVRGPIVPGSPPTTYSAQGPDVLSCGS